MAPVRVVRAFRFPITVIMTALALSGCMRTTGPVAVAPQSDLDAMTYGQTYAPAPVAVGIEAYRPFFILGEVAAPGQYPYVPNMTVESAVAIAGGFSPRARRDRVTVTHTDASGTGRYVVPPGTSLSPGDTVLVGERWF